MDSKMAVRLPSDTVHCRLLKEEHRSMDTPADSCQPRGGHASNKYGCQDHIKGGDRRTYIADYIMAPI